MKNLILSLSKLDRRHIQVILAIVCLVLFVLGAGAPAGSGTGF
jgi:hypothetical protein